ncbi:hypothetical protein [Teichococcus aestuarii]|uniref:hypothetical protein n=1 Tax=Teichococcus aestuarii TaxID=568898 RepID=UPI00360DB3E6
MTLTQILDASALTVLAAQAGWIALLYRRMGRLRSALEGAGEVIAQLDEASRRLDASAGGIVQKVRDGIAEVDSKITACRRLSQELSAASRNAEEVALRLDQALRQNRKLNAARAAAPPRELVEPLGLADRLSARPAPAFPASAEPPIVDVSAFPPASPPASLAAALSAPLPAPLSASLQVPLPSSPPAEPPLERLLAAELLFADLSGPAAAAAVPAQRTIRVKLD